MRCDLESAYVPSCVTCHRNKSTTLKPIGSLHLLPVPNACGDSIAMDFIGPLPVDNGNYGIDCTLTITDRLGSDVWVIPCSTNLTAEQLANLFFVHWYCENGLPTNIVSDQDKLFLSRFWRALHACTGVKLKICTAYHPEMDGTSKHTNKTINQCIHFYVEHNPKGWAKTLPLIHFNIMNTVNKST